MYHSWVALSVSSPQPPMAPDIHITGRALHAMTPLQVHALYKLRVDIFVHEQQAPYAEIDDTDAHPKTHHILAYIHPGSGPDYPWGAPDPGSPLRLVGTARIFGSPEEQHIGRVCVHPALRSLKVGHRLMEEALEVCQARAAALDPTLYTPIVTLDAQTYIHKFYESHGFQTVGDPFDLDGVEHIKMQRTL